MSARILRPVVSVQITAKGDRQKPIAHDSNIANAFQMLQIDDDESDAGSEDEQIAIDDLPTDLGDSAPQSDQPEVYTPVIDEASDLQFRYSCEVEEAEKTLEFFALSWLTMKMARCILHPLP